MQSRQILRRNKEKVQKQRDNFFKKSKLGWDWDSIHINGIIVFYDIAQCLKEKVGDVPKFWKEIKRKNWGIDTLI